MGVLECHQLTAQNKMVELKTHKLCVKNWVKFMVEVQIRGWVTYGSSRLILVGLGNLRFRQVNPGWAG
jgi:hypothetical protein